MDSTSVVLESQPDWITVGGSSPTAFNALLAWSVRHLELERELGNKGKPFHLLGFAGERCGRLAYGVCGRGVVVQLSGDLAHLHLDDLLRRAERLSRIDLAVTVRLDDPDGRTPMEHCLEYQAWTPRGRPKARAKLIWSSDGGTTFYIGNRSGDYQLRVYDKWRESREPRYERAIRYELECKGAAAVAVARSCAGAADRAAHCQTYVHNYCSEHGLAPRFACDGGRVLIPGFHRRTDADTRLAWIARQVAPAAAWLREHGREADLERALTGDVADENRAIPYAFPPPLLPGSNQTHT